MTKTNNERAKKGTKLIILSVFICGIIFFFYWFFYLKNFVTTDDAYVHADSSYVSSRIPGTIEKVYVKNDDFVKKGTILLLLDPAVYKLKVEQLQNKLESLDFKIKSTEIELDILKHNLKKNIKKAHNDMNLAYDEKNRINTEIRSLIAQRNSLEQDFHLAKLQYKRYKRLYKRHTIPKEKFDEVETTYNKLKYQIESITHKIASLKIMEEESSKKTKNAEIAMSIARKNELKILSATESLNALKKERGYLRAALNEAKLQLSYCKIKAPISGYVAGSKLQRGNRVLPGQVLLVVVPLDQVYVEANFKETQLTDIRIGQRAEIRADMYPHIKFYGHVVGIRAGTGQVFSLLPPENASGNWIKVVQRIPVKIELDNYDYKKNPLRLGASLIVKIDIRDKSGKTLR